MKRNSKFILIIFLFFIIFLLTISLQFKIKDFMSKVEMCEDDFRVIEHCGCCPLEGDYSYFKNSCNKNIEEYEI